MNLKHIMLNQISEMQKIKYCMNPFIWNVQRMQTYSDRKNSGCLGLRVGMQIDCKWT